MRASAWPPWITKRRDDLWGGLTFLPGGCLEHDLFSAKEFLVIDEVLLENSGISPWGI